MTLLIYAKRKGIALEKVKVTLGHSRVHAADCVDCETKDGFVTELQRDIELTGALSDAQRQRLMEIAAMCPVHRTLTAEIKIRDRMV
jgi:putative redox protein